MGPSTLLEPVGAPGHQERRGSTRVPLIRPCPYEISKFPSEGSIELSQGFTLSLNISAGGMLLLMPHVPGERQIFQVLAPSVTREEAATKLVEVCWTREVPVGLDPGTYLVGVKFLFEVPS